jgi:hypothetical protein
MGIIRPLRFVAPAEHDLSGAPLRNDTERRSAFQVPRADHGEVSSGLYVYGQGSACADEATVTFLTTAGCTARGSTAPMSLEGTGGRERWASGDGNPALAPSPDT